MYGIYGIRLQTFIAAKVNKTDFMLLRNILFLFLLTWSTTKASSLYNNLRIKIHFFYWIVLYVTIKILHFLNNYNTFTGHWFIIFFFDGSSILRKPSIFSTHCFHYHTAILPFGTFYRQVVYVHLHVIQPSISASYSDNWISSLRSETFSNKRHGHFLQAYISLYHSP